MNLKQKINLLTDYENLLHAAEADKAFVILHANNLPPETYNQLLANADADITFAKTKIQQLIPPIPSQNFSGHVASKLSTFSTHVVPEATPAATPAPSNDNEISPWQILGWTAGAAGLFGLLLWGVQSKENLKTTADILHLAKKAIDPSRN